MYDVFQRELKKIVREARYPVEFRVAPIAELLSARIDNVDLEAGTSRTSFTADERFVHGGGVVQGGIVSCMLDFGMACLLLAELDDGFSIATTNLNIEYFAPAPPGVYVASAKVIRKGRKISFSRADLHNEGGKHIAAASATNVVIDIRERDS